jgi:multicomponent Na+:H+ antiporter subunit C
MMGGLFIIITSQNYLKKIVGLLSSKLPYLYSLYHLAKVLDGTAPILTKSLSVYSNPLPHMF